MPDVIKVACPNCAKAMAVPTTMAGKKIKCKGCETVFPVKGGPAAGGGAKPAAQPAKPKKATPAAPPPPPPPAGPARSPAAMKAAAEFDADGNPYDLPPSDDDVPRCPFCAVDLDPPDTKVCMSCGFNLLERRRYHTTKVYQLSFGDYLKYHLPTIGFAIVIAVLVAIIIIVWTQMREWFHGPLDFLEQDEKDENTDQKKTFIPPGACSMAIIVPSLYGIFLAGRFIFRRLVFRFRPPDVIKKK